MRAAIDADYSTIVTENLRREQEAREAAAWRDWYAAEPGPGATIEAVRAWVDHRPDRRPARTGSADGGAGKPIPRPRTTALASDYLPPGHPYSTRFDRFG
jgi:hypothetical protein